jgi:hypothetical protein
MDKVSLTYTHKELKELYRLLKFEDGMKQFRKLVDNWEEFKEPLEDMPLYINETEEAMFLRRGLVDQVPTYRAIISKWRLQIGR